MPAPDDVAVPLPVVPVALAPDVELPDPIMAFVNLKLAAVLPDVPVAVPVAAAAGVTQPVTVIVP